MRSHLRSPDEMNWSNTTCAPLAKSPNCASHNVKRVGLGQGVAVFETEHGLFREHRVDDLVAGLRLADMVEGRVALLVLLIDQNRMPLTRMCRARHPGRTGGPRWSSTQQRTECQRLAPSPSRCPRPVSIIFLRLSRKRWIVR